MSVTIEMPHDEESRTDDWADDNPFCLFIESGDEAVQIDLGERGWATTYADWMRKPGIFALQHKTTQAMVLVIQVHEGDQPYYTAHHVGVTGSAGGNEIIAYGVGKKAPDGTMTRLWIMPGWMICGGDDVDELGVRMVKLLGPRQAEF